MAKALFISDSFLKENSIINDNTDMEILTPTILWVQDHYLQKILGTDLFDQINSQINSSSVSANNQTLLNNYIMDILFWYILCEASTEFVYRYMNKGIMVKGSENSQPASLEAIQMLMTKYKNRAEWYAQRLTDYLQNNQSTYPLYLQNTDATDIQPNQNNFKCSFFLSDEYDDISCYDRKHKSNTWDL